MRWQVSYIYEIVNEMLSQLENLQSNATLKQHTDRLFFSKKNWAKLFTKVRSYPQTRLDFL